VSIFNENTFYQPFLENDQKTKKWSSRKTSKMRLNFTANSFIHGHTECENAARTFSVNLGSGGLPKCVLTSQQTETASFLNTSIVKMHLGLFCVTCKRRTFKMRLNFMANCFVHGHINRENAPRRFSVKLARTELHKYV